MAHMSEQLRDDINGVRGKALGLGVLGVLVSLSALLIHPPLFFRAWLVAWAFTFFFAAGGLAAVLLRHLAGGAWSVVMQRIAEAAARTLWIFAPVYAVIFLFGKHYLYPWTLPDYVAGHEVVQAKEGFLNEPFFWLRFVVYFAVWLSFGTLYARWSQRLDETGDGRYAVWMQRLSGPGIVLFFLTMTLAATDWGMSLEPTWFSTVYGPMWIVSQGLSIIALALVIITCIDHEQPIAGHMTTKTYVDLGNLFLGFVVMWSYLSFSQYLIIWSGNLPEGISWYLRRTGTGLVLIAFVLTLLHFVVPMLVLIIRRTKADVLPLRQTAVMVLVLRFADIYWTLVPSFEGYANRIGGWMTVYAVVATVGFGGLWLWHFLGLLLQRPLVPVHDPRATMLLEKERREAHSHA